MPYNTILYLRLPYFHVSNSALFSTSVLSFYINVVLTLSTKDSHWDYLWGMYGNVSWGSWILVFDMDNHMADVMPHWNQSPTEVIFDTI